MSFVAMRLFLQLLQQRRPLLFYARAAAYSVSFIRLSPFVSQIVYYELGLSAVFFSSRWALFASPSFSSVAVGHSFCFFAVSSSASPSFLSPVAGTSAFLSSYAGSALAQTKAPYTGCWASVHVHQLPVVLSSLTAWSRF